MMQEVPAAGGSALAASIVIITWNELAYTRRCVESLQRHTPEPHELIFVDNGSTDGTVDYLRALPGARVLTNPSNRGFAAAANQGMLAATSRHILLLNNDTVVTAGWLGRMLAAFERDPQVGLVGPRSNYVVGPQLLADVPYGDDLAGLEEFAAERARLYAGQGFERQDRASGFCLLLRRPVIDAVGGLDTRYGSGNYEDDDFCLRARLAGYKIWIADDVFIHHFGGRTFKGANIDYFANLEQNWAKFKAKWLLPPDLPSQLGYPAARLLQLPSDPKLNFCPLAPPLQPPAESGYELFSQFLTAYNYYDYPAAVATAGTIMAELERPGSPYREDEILFFLGNGFASTGDYDQARTCYRASQALAEQRYRHLQAAPAAAQEEQRFRQLTSVLANNMALLAYAQGRGDEASQLLADAAQAGNRVAARNRQAMSRYETTLDLQEIRGEARRLPLCERPLAARWRELGTIACRQQDFTAALGYYQAVCRTLEAGPQDRHDLAMVLVGIGDAHQATGEQGRAMEAYRQALEVVPDHPAVQGRIAALLRAKPDARLLDDWRKQGHQAFAAADYATARSWFELVVRSEAVQPRDWHNLGSAHYLQGDYARALAAYRQAVPLAPAHAPSYKFIGTTLVPLGDLPTARRFLLRARELNPFLAEVQAALLQVETELARQSEAELQAGPRPDPELVQLLAGPAAPRLSLCMIVKDEELTLADCLASARPVVDELIVVDTGSSDGTVAVAEQFGARVFHYPWGGDFSAARNESLEHAGGDWILVLDADERLRPASYAALRDTISLYAGGAADPISYMLRIVNLLSGAGNETAEHYTLRLFTNSPQLRYRGYIHEQMPMTGHRQYFASEIVIDHHGYQAAYVVAKQKEQRNRELIEKAVAADPNEPFHRYNLGAHLYNAGQFERAVEELEAVLGLCERLQQKYLWMGDAYDKLAYGLVHLRRLDEAYVYCEKGLAAEPNHAGLWVSKGQVHLDRGEYDEALASLEHARSLAGVSQGLNVTFQRDSTWVPLFGIGLVHAVRGRHQLARQYFDQALALKPDNTAILEQLARLPRAGGAPD